MHATDFLPPIVTRFMLRALGRSTLRGNYPSWQEALAAGECYRTDLAIYGKLTDEIRAGARRSSRVLSPIMSAFLLVRDNACVMDFGGNLGFVYFDVSHFVRERISQWNVVDLPDVVAHGNQNFAHEKLRFFESIDAAAARGKPNIVILVHVLQYLEAPFDCLSQLISLEPQVVVIHELPLAERERFMIQLVMPELGGGSRPVRIFRQDDLDVAFAEYELVEELTLPVWDRTLSNVRNVARVYRRRSRSDDRLACVAGVSISNPKSDPS